MTDFHDHISNAGRDVALSDAERRKMRETLVSYMEMRPVRTVRPAPARFLPVAPVFFSRAMAFAILCAVVGSSAGISYAAESSLPGDTLYAVKVRINEPVRGVLAVTPAAKASWAMDIAATRATEAATLAAEDKLSASTSAQLQQSFVAHAREATASIAAQSRRDPAAGAELATRFEARLAEYERVLGAIDTGNGSGTGIASAIRGERAQVLALSTASDTDADTAHLHVAAQESVTAATQLVPAALSALSTTTAAQIAFKLDQTNDAIASGQDLLARDDRSRASGEFRKAIQVSERLSTFLQTSAAIHEHTGLVITSADSATEAAPHPAIRAKSAAPIIRAAVMMAPAAATATPEPESQDASATSEEQQAETHEHELSIPLPDL